MKKGVKSIAQRASGKEPDLTPHFPPFRMWFFFA